MPIAAELLWTSPHIHHRERLLLPDNALLADGRWARAAERARSEGRAELDAAPWITPSGLPVVERPAAGVRLGTSAVPGRFYPRLGFPGLAQGPRDLFPLRLLDCNEERIRVDPNHPLASGQARLILTPSGQEAAPGQRMIELFNGPGLQALPGDSEVTFFQLSGFQRPDEAPDPQFYAEARLTQHLDAACRAEISQLYGRLLQPGQRVLDLLASWDSHLPQAPADLHVAGLGMNREELAANPRLHEMVEKDLNERSDLPWGEGQFDVVVCTAAIEYLIRPRQVLAEIRRVLRPGGTCIITFSDRWFPPKAIQLWSQLHPFERLAYVLALLQDAGFRDLHSETLRGLKRPEDDKYIDQRNSADPLFAAWGKVPE